MFTKTIRTAALIKVITVITITITITGLIAIIIISIIIAIVIIIVSFCGWFYGYLLDSTYLLIDAWRNIGGKQESHWF